MENERPSCEGASKSTKKTKAAGAFRVFLNFLQKPAKKKHENENSLKGETNVGSHFDLVVPHELESGEREFAVKGKDGDLDNSRSWSFSAGGVPDGIVDEEEATLSSIPEGRDLLPMEESPMVRGGDVEVDDDEVFLSESYFEDDYFEDFSSSSSDSNSNSNLSNTGAGGANDKDNVTPHCDDDFIKFIDSIPYLNNFDTANEVDKGYNKLFPDFICRDYRNLNQNMISPPLTDRPRHRQRHCSMPCSLVGDSPRSRSDGRSSSDKSLTDGEEEKLLTLPLAAAEAAVVAVDIARSLQAPAMTFPVKSRSESDIILPNENDNDDPYGDCTAGTPGISENVNVRIPTSDMLGLLLLGKITTPSDRGAISNNDNNGLQMKIEPHSESRMAGMTGDATRTSIHLDTIRLDTDIITANPASSCSTLQPKSVYEGDVVNINTTHNVVVSQSASAAAAAATTCKTTAAALTSKERKELINCNRRHSCLGSVESGYGSACRSSASTPLSPSTGKAAMATATPMNKLLVGTPLSPHSLNTLDGVTKPRPTPKRRLKPKFIFPTLTPSELKLKSVPELVELIADIARMKSQIEDGTKGAKDATMVSKKLMPSQKNKEIVDPGTVLKLSDSGIGINLNLSLKAVDVNNNLIHPHTDQPQSPIPYCYTNITSSPLSRNIVTSPGLSRTPRSRHPMSDLNDFTILSPFGKDLRPICTSSPLQSKLAARRRSQRDARSSPMHKLLLESPAIACANNLKDLTYVMSPPKKEKDQKENYIPRTAATSERRKKLKRRSARTRLHFDERDVNNNKKAKECEDVEDDEKNRNHRHPTSGDYVLLKRIAESIIDECSNREMIESMIDLPGLMENLNGQYSRIMKSHHIDSNHKFSNLKTNVIEIYKRVSTNLTLENCIDIVLMSFLVRDAERMVASLDFVFENLPRVIPQHEFLSALAPEMVILLLTNPRCIVKNNHGFPLSYSSSEKEVFKAIVKYVEAVNRKNKKPVDDRVKNLLSTVADPRVLANKITMNSVERSDSHSHSHADVESHGSIIVAKRPPRPFHNLVFQRSSSAFASGAARNREYFFQPFVSSSVQSLDEITGRNNNEIASPTPTSSVCKENYILRKLYFSYRRYSNVPFITKIGMQYSCKGKKKTVFISQSETVGRTSFPQGLNPYNEPVLGHVDYDDIIAGDETAAVMNLNSDHLGRVPEVEETPSCVVEPAGNELESEVTVVKKAAIVLKAGEHITALSVLGRNVIHNVEIVTNTGRRIRAHGLQDVASERWVAIATPEGSTPFCLHAIYGDARKSSGRSYIHDLGAIWVSTESAINKLS